MQMSFSALSVEWTEVEIEEGKKSKRKMVSWTGLFYTMYICDLDKKPWLNNRDYFF